MALIFYLYFRSSCGERKKLKFSEHEGCDSDEDCTFSAISGETSKSSVKHNQKFRTTRKYSDIRYKLQLKKSEASTEIKPSCVYTDVVEEIERKKVKPKHLNKSIKSGNSLVVIYDVNDRNTAPRLEKTEDGLKVIETYSADSIANVEEVIQTAKENKPSGIDAKEAYMKKIVEEHAAIALLIKNEDNRNKIGWDSFEIIKDVNSDTSDDSIDSIEDITGENIAYSTRSLDQLNYSEESQSSLDSASSDDDIEGELEEKLSMDSKENFEDTRECLLDDTNEYFEDNDEIASSSYADESDYNFGGEKDFNVSLMHFDANLKFPFKTKENYFSDMFLRSYLPAHGDERGLLSSNFCRPIFTDSNSQIEKASVDVKNKEYAPVPSKNLVPNKIGGKNKKLLAKTNHCVQEINKRTTLNILESQKFDFAPNLCEQNTKHLQQIRSFSPATNCRERKTLTKPFFLNRSEFQAHVRELYLGDKKTNASQKHRGLIPSDAPFTKIKLHVIDSTELFQTSWKTKADQKIETLSENVRALKKIECKKLPSSNHDLPSFCVVEGLNKTKNFSNKTLRVTKRLVAAPPDSKTDVAPDENKEMNETLNSDAICNQETTVVVEAEKQSTKDEDEKTEETETNIEVNDNLSEDSLDCRAESVALSSTDRNADVKQTIEEEPVDVVSINRNEEINAVVVAPPSEKSMESNKEGEIKNEKKKVSFELPNEDETIDANDAGVVETAIEEEPHVIPENVLDNILTNMKKEQEIKQIIEIDVPQLESKQTVTSEHMQEVNSSETNRKERNNETEELKSTKMKKKRSRSNKRKDKNVNPVELSDEENESCDDRKCFNVKNKKKNRDACTIS